MCTVLLPPGGYPIAGNKYININPFFFLCWTNQFGCQSLQPLNHLQSEVQHITQLARRHRSYKGQSSYFFGIFPHKHCCETTVCSESKI